MTNRPKIVLLFLLLLTVGCKEFPNPFEGDRVLAKVDGVTLRMMDVQSIFPRGISGEDSVQLLETYVDRWVRDQLKLQEATRIFRSSESNIERLVEQYRNTLLTHKFEQYCIDQATGDSLYTETDLQSYYLQHRGEYILDRDIVKGTVVVCPDNYRQKSKIKELLGSGSKEKKEDLKAICEKNEFSLQEVTEWTDFSDFLTLLPAKRNERYDNLLKQQGVQEMVDGNMHYYFLIADYRTAGMQSPYERVKDVVRWVVINQRKAEIVKAYEDSVYQQALPEKNITINL